MGARNLCDLLRGFERLAGTEADIRRMLAELHGEGGVLNFQDTHRNPQDGQEYPVFLLPKRETLILIAGYSVQMRARIIDRWRRSFRVREGRVSRVPKRAIGEMYARAEQAAVSKGRISNVTRNVRARGAGGGAP